MRVDTIIAETNMLRKPSKRRAVSPVIATVIIVAVTITVAVAVSYWMSGIASQYTSFEKVEIQTAICTYDKTLSYWKIVIDLKNSGTKAATLSNVFVNDIETEYNSTAPIATGEDAITAQLDRGADPAVPLHIESGVTDYVTVWISPGTTNVLLSAGTTINIKIHSASGMDYIRLVQLT